MGDCLFITPPYGQSTPYLEESSSFLEGGCCHAGSLSRLTMSTMSTMSTMKHIHNNVLLV